MRSDDMGEKDPKLEDNAAEGGKLNEDHSEDSSGSYDDNNQLTVTVIPVLSLVYGLP